jgi:hypothetical protein
MPYAYVVAAAFAVLMCAVAAAGWWAEPDIDGPGRGPDWRP